MTLRSVLLTTTVVAVGCGTAVVEPIEDETDSPTGDGWAAYSLDALLLERQQRGTSFLEVEVDSLFRLGLLHREPGQSLGLATHDHNVLYFVSAGEALLSTESEDHPLAPGSLAFVRGGVEHRFRSIAAELEVITIFSQRLPIPQDPEIVSFGLDEMVAARDGEMNVWTGLLETSSMNAGMYMLPKGSRDEDLLTHAFDEFKITVNGGGRFDIGADGLEVIPGSIARIGSGIRHGFRRVSEDLDVLVIWGR